MDVFWIFLFMMTISSVLVVKLDVRWWLKGLFILFLVASSCVAFKFIENYEGQPRTTSVIPSEVTVYGQKIDKEGGVIYLLYSEAGQEDALYWMMDYNENLHKALNKGSRESKGKQFILKSKKGDGKGDGEKGDGKPGKPGEGESDKKSKGSSISLESATFDTFKLPTPELPEKS